LEIGSTTTTTTSASESANAALAADFDTFLTLLTTQLQNQDPLSPLDSNQFTEQLVQFSQVEQAIATNENLEDVLALIGDGNTASAVSYLGKDILAEGNAADLANGQATWDYALADPAQSTTITVTDENGKLVLATPGQQAAGQHTFVWDGLDSSGEALPDGVYHIAVAAQNAEGESVGVTTYSTGEVTGVNTGADGTQLLLGQVTVPMSAVVRVQDPEPSA